MARNSKSPNSEDNGLGLKQEVVGILVLAVALYIGVSLFSARSGANWGGFIGGHLASVLSSVIGYTSYVFPFLLAAVAFKSLLRRVIKISGALPLGLAIFIPSFSAVLSALVEAPGAGGVVGEILSATLMKYLGSTGAYIILFAVVLASVLLVTGTSLIQGGIKLAYLVAALFKTLFSLGKKLRRPKKRSKEAVRPEPGGRPGQSLAGGPDRDKGEDKDRVPAIIAPETHAPPPTATVPAGKAEKKKEAAASDGEDDEHLEFTGLKGSFKLPPLTLLDPVPETHNAIDKQTLLDNSKTLEKKLLDFGVEGRVLEVRPGPVVTMYEFEPAAGVKVGRITSLADDLALAMKAMSIRIIAPIPGKSVVGIEIPNHERGEILLREILESPAYSKARSRLSLALGKDIAGNPYIADLAKMPHLLVAGATGTGKSVSVNAMIQSILFKATPEEVRFLLVDPKMLELSAYEGIPHLITPVITNPKRATMALKSIVAEMGRRYKLMAMKGTKNIERYNRLIDGGGEGAGTVAGQSAPGGHSGPGGDGAEDADVEHQRLPYIVVIIDELADLMMTSGKDVEECLVRLSQMARAAGIHLIVATQRPSVDVVTGLIKTNFPARIAFQLPSRIDSRTILDRSGAEKLLGDGDMLFLPPSTAKLQRVHGVFVSEKEIKRVTDFWKAQGGPAYDKIITEETARAGHEDGEDLGEEFLKRYDEAVALASTLEMISTSYLQRRFRIGYNTAARLIERMEAEGIVGPSQGSRPREVLMRKEV